MKSRAILSFAGFVLAILLVSASITFNSSKSKGHRRISSAAGLEKEAVAFDQPDEANEYFLLKRSPDGHSPIQVQRYLEAIERVKRMPQYSTASRTNLPPLRDIQAAAIEPQALGAWTPLGPGNIGGRTRALLINPNDPNVMYLSLIHI